MPRGISQRSLLPPAGVANVEGEWRYAEFAAGGHVLHVGNATEPATGVTAASPTPAAPLSPMAPVAPLPPVAPALPVLPVPPPEAIAHPVR